VCKVPFCAFRAWLFRLTFDLGGVGTAYCTFHIAYRILLAVLGCRPQLKAFANQRPIYMHFMWQRLLLFPSLFQLHLLGGRPPTGTATHHPLFGFGGRKRGLPINFFDCRRRNFYGFLLLFCIFMVF